VNLAQIHSAVPEIFEAQTKNDKTRAKEVLRAFLFLVTLTYDLDIQTRPSEGPNVSSLLIWRKSVQRFPVYLMHKPRKMKKSQRYKNRTLRAVTN